MAECQENPLSFEEKEEDFGSKLAVNTSQKDERQYWQKYSSIVDHCESSKSNQDQQSGKDRKVGDGGQAECGSEQRNSNFNINSHENNSGQELEEKRCEVRTGNNNVEASQQSQVRMEENSGQVGGQQGTLHYAEQESMSGNGGKELSGADRNETKVGQEKGAIESRNPPTSYLEAAKTNIPQKSYNMGPIAPELTKVRSASEFTHGRSSQRVSGVGNKVTKTGQGIDPSIVTKQRNAHRSYSEAAATNIPQAQYFTPVSFYLLILGDRSVDQANIHVGPDETRQMRRVPGNYNLWEYSTMLCGDPIKNCYEYKYGFREKGQDFTVPIFGRIGMLSKDSSYCVESSQRQLGSDAHFDIFHFSDDESYYCDTIPKGVVIYMKWLFSFVSRRPIAETLIQIEKFPFNQLGRKYIQDCLNFVVIRALDFATTDVECLYLCIVLSHVVKPDSSLLPFPNDDDNKTAATCDRLLQCLSTCAYSNPLSMANLDCLKKIALLLVESSNSPGWLTLAVHFYPYLGPEFVLNKKYTAALNYTYDSNEYKKMVSSLLLHIKEKNDDDKAIHQQLLHFVLENAQNIDAVWQIYEIVDFSLFFHSEEEKVSFFVDFYKQEDIGNKKQTVGLKLTGFCNIPKNIREKMHKFLIQILLQFAKSDEDLNDEHAKLFLEVIITEDLGVNQLFQVFVELSRSKSAHRQDLLLKILDNELFDDHWREAELAEKLHICKTWVKERTMNMRCNSNLDDVGKIVTAYEAINAVMQCSLNISNKTLAKHLSTSVVEGILKRVEVISFIQAFDNLEKCAAIVQECYKSDLKNGLGQASKAVKKSRMFLRECSRSSCFPEILPCILDCLDVPKIMEVEGAIDEVHFTRLLHRCDTWLFLLAIPEIVEQLKDCRTGKKICEQLAIRIKKSDVSVSMLKKMYNEKEKVSKLCASVLNDSMQTVTNSDVIDLQKEILDCISKLWRIEQDCSQNVQLLESAIELGKKLSSNISYPIRGMKTIIRMFSDLKTTMDSRRVHELQDDTFWGELLPFLSPAKALQPLVKSVSFMNVAKNLTSNGQGQKETAVSDFYSLMMFLTTTAIEELQLQWNPAFDDAGTLTVETMKTLLGALRDDKRLDEELELLAKYFRRPFPPNAKTYIHDFVKYPDVLEQMKHVIGILNTFKLVDSPNESTTLLLQFQTLENSDMLSLVDLHQSIEDVREILSSFSGEGLGCIMEDLSRSSELLDFVEEIVDEDIRFLIDGVEEYSDQFINESSVSDLIDVHGFLAPLIIKKNEYKCDPQDFLKMLEESCLSHKDIAVKIRQCNTNVNSLRELYSNIANRGEVTKDIIGNCLTKGEYWVSQKGGKCETKMSYVLQESVQRTYSLSDLHDLRSRAHLIVSSRKNTIKMQSSHSYEVSQDIDFDDFIKQVNLLTEISIILSKLCSSGYVKYRDFWKLMKTTNDLQTNKDSLQNDLENWENILKNARDIFYYLNYYYSDQLCRLYDFFMSESNVTCEDVLSLIHFVDRTITKQQLQQHQHSQNILKTPGLTDTPEFMVSTVGQALQNIFSNSQKDVRPISDFNQSRSFSKMEATVNPGEIFIASLEPESPLTANVILTLYENTSNAYPEPYQIVFCSSQTTWEELHLLLQRCFGHSRHFNHESLFCIANVELLPNELQFTLVDAIKDEQISHQSSEAIEDNADYQLALICRGGDHHHVVAQFAKYSHHITGMSDRALGNCLKSGWPNVKMITSSLPGLGKTEQIKSEALEKSMNVVTFSISGPFEPRKLTQRLKSLKLKAHNCLHLNIGEVSDPLLLDTFLFQLIITGMVSAGNQFYHLLTRHIYIEIANTLNDWLRDSLVVSKYFPRVHLNWRNYADLLVSSKITSNVQVVCQYLDIFDRGCIDTKEIIFNDSKRSKPVPTLRCQELLAKYFSSDINTTFTTLHTFLDILADQLLKFSKSAFFKIECLTSMVGEEAQDIRKNLLDALLEVSKEFASRSLTTCKSCDTQNLSRNECRRALGKEKTSVARSAENMVERVKGMIQWEDNNHLLVVFQGLDSQAITAMYRNKALVPPNVEKLLLSQDVRENKELDDFNNFTQEQLLDKLERIACIEVVEKRNLFPSYALTPDNILKMILIILRVRVNVPVIIMGETGCGKTSLIRYLANTCGVQFHKLDLHAGISEDEVIAFITEKESYVKVIKARIWIFLDEINACDHLGLISDIMCHHSLLGRPLSKKLVFLAACNPYHIRPNEQIKTAGLDGKDITDECSKLVYRVHPLPEAMIDYVWDYGSLSLKDERNYIQRMVKGFPEIYEVMVDLLAASQKFIRNAENNHFCVSLRDVHRCIYMVCWFQKMMKRRTNPSFTKEKCPNHLLEYQRIAEKYNEKPMVKSIVLALALCYLTRLQSAEFRKKYRECMIDLFSRNGIIMTNDENVDSFAAIVRMEQENYLSRMELPRGTARNAALRENVFVMLVCILNRIPIFVVGKPGCSKSLSIQLIRSNLRGRDSRDPWFREMPQLYVVSYQGSESSTSEGIVKVFEKARKYKSHKSGGNILPVVLLDEVGLAENSKYNPLKVLHSLLEPGEGKFPDVAVVGISNWSLDAAKMNRAIHLSRPEPTMEDLCETGCSLHYADSDDSSQNLGKEELKCLTEAYLEYQSQQSHPNFHGLRDYYSMIKSLTGCSSFEHVNISLQRNFGGLPGEETKIQKIFLDKLKKHMVWSNQEIIPVTELIQRNFEDPYARHLMLITSGDSAIGILERSLAKVEKETLTIYGSRFEEDLSEEYNYRILSRIILCMERDCILILKDLESIYGSLYDMLNQNYAVVGNRKNCRVALGAYSNPMCQVNDGFRCVVLIDEQKVDYSEPPFLNRFEKQVLRLTDVLTESQQNVIAELDTWVDQMSTVEGLEQHFSKSDLFIGFHQDTLQSLVFSYGQDTDSSAEEVLKKCKDDLMWIASPDGVLRAKSCKLVEENRREVHELSDGYFKKPLHQGIAAFMEHVVTDQHNLSLFASDKIGSKTVIMTFSNIHTDIYQCLGNRFRCQIERLSAYKSEKQLAEKISEFWNAPGKELLVLQCKPDLDGIHSLLARSIVEEKRNFYKQCFSGMNTQGYKHVCIVLHVERGQVTDSVSWQLNFMCGWRQVFLDILEAPLVPLSEIVSKSVHDLLTSPIWPICKIARNDIFWCFTCIKYAQNHRPVDTVLRIAKNIFSSQKVLKAIETLILHSIDQNAADQDHDPYIKRNWQVKVACDRQLLFKSSTLYSAMEKFVARLVRNLLAKIIYFLEKENAWPPHLLDASNETMEVKLEDLWCSFVTRNTLFKISDIPEPRGAESYVLDRTSLDLRFPFSQCVYRKIDSVKELFLDDCARLVEIEENSDENGQQQQVIREKQIERLSKMIRNLIPIANCHASDCSDAYMKDAFDMITADFSRMLGRSQRVEIAQALFITDVKGSLPAKDFYEFVALLHIFVWIHREQVLDVLRLVDRCQPFIGLHVLLNVTNAMYGKPQKLMLTFDEADIDSVLESQETQYTTHSLANTPHSKALNRQEQSEEKQIGIETKVANLEFEFEIEKPVSNFESNEEEAEKQVEHCEDLEKFEDMLVTAYCEEMLPSQEIVERNGGLESWIRNTSMMLSLAFKISIRSPASHYLRLCLDFSKIIFTSAALSTRLSSLYILDEIGKSLAPQYLDHERSFEKITDQVIKPLEEDMKEQPDKQRSLQKFSALFYGRCIDTNVDSSVARLMIIERFFSLERPELVMMMSPVILRLLMVEQVDSPKIFTDIIVNPSAIENCPCLQNIDEVFKENFLKTFVHHDSYPAVVICDLIQSLLNFTDHFKIDDIDSRDCEVLSIAKSAVTVVSQNSKDYFGLELLSSVAFLRGFFTMFAKFLTGNRNVLSENSPYIFLITEVNSLIKDPGSPSQIFFMKQLYQNARLFDLQKWFAKSNILLTREELWFDGQNQDKAVFTCVLKYPEYGQARTAYWRLKENDDSYMLEFVKMCSISSNHGFALLGMLINMVYLKRAVRKLNDTEEHLLDWFVDKIASLPLLFQQLLLRVIGRRDFHCPQLQLSPESSINDVEMALLVLHIACVVATGTQSENLPIYCYFTNPTKFGKPSVLAHCQDDVRSLFEYQLGVNESVFVTCVCGLRLAFKSDVNEKACPDCHEVLDDNEIKSCTSPETTATLLMVFNDEKNSEWNLCTKHMNPAVYRALHFIVYLSYYAGIAIETSSEEKLSTAMGEFDLERNSTSPARFCFASMENDLLCIMKILSCEKKVAIKTMHLVMDKSSKLISSSNLLEGNDCSTQEMRREWEARFSQLVETVCSKESKTSIEIRKMMKLQQREQSHESTFESCILELDGYPEEQEQQNKQLMRLFRVTKQPNFEDFRSAFLYAPKNAQEKHRFLTLFFATFDKLSVIGNLHHLLKWSRLVSSALTHRISRKDAQSKLIKDFIYGHVLEIERSQPEIQSLKELFNNFKEAWNEMRLLVNQTLVGKQKMPRVSEAACVAYCLTESDCGIYLQTAIKILVSMQNSILDAAVSLSSHRHPAVTFLEKDNCSGVISSVIQDVKEAEIICFQWSDDLLQRHAQNSPEYGKGQEITYDFERIEIELAREIAFGKHYLIGTLNKFVFAKELFHSCGSLLTEIRSLVKQSPTLPEGARKSLANLKERGRIKEVQDLLQQIEVLIYLLKRKLKHFNVDMALEELAEEWSSILPSPFPVKLLPEPRDAIKIKHVAALYEALEDVLADSAVDGLADQFRKQLPGEVKKIIGDMGEKRTDQLRPQNFLKALRRFVFRYLSSETERYWPEESTALQTCLKETSLWSPSQPPCLDEIPQDITLEYIHSIIQHFEETEKEKKRDNVRTRRGLESSSRLLRAPKQSSGRRQLSANFSFS